MENKPQAPTMSPEARSRTDWEAESPKIGNSMTRLETQMTKVLSQIKELLKRMAQTKEWKGRNPQPLDPIASSMSSNKIVVPEHTTH
jgi:hypothetical protein